MTSKKAPPPKKKRRMSTATHASTVNRAEGVDDAHNEEMRQRELVSQRERKLIADGAM